MKLFLSIKQLSELKGRQIVRLAKWCNEHDYFVWIPDESGTLQKHVCDLDHLPQLSIGQLIELLDWEDCQYYKVPPKGGRYDKSLRGKWRIQDGDYENASASFTGEHLIDAYWEAVKEKLKTM